MVAALPSFLDFGGFSPAFSKYAFSLLSVFTSGCGSVTGSGSLFTATASGSVCGSVSAGSETGSGTGSTSGSFFATVSEGLGCTDLG